MGIYLLIKLPTNSYSIKLPHGGLSIGRSEKCDVTIKDPKISGKHCIFTMEDDQIFVEDNQTTNGTLLNGSSITKSRLYLFDIVKLGSLQIKIDHHKMSSRQKNLHSKEGVSPNKQMSVNSSIIQSIENKTKSGDHSIKFNNDATQAQNLGAFLKGLNKKEIKPNSPKQVADSNNDEPKPLKTKEKRKKSDTGSPSRSGIPELASEESFDLDAETGKTKFIQVTATKKKVAKKPKKVRKKKKVVENDSILDKIKKAFKK